MPFLLAGLMTMFLLVAPASAADWLCWKGERVRSAAAPARLDVTDRFVAGHAALARPAGLCTAAADGAVPSGAPVTAAAWTIRQRRKAADDVALVTVTNRFGDTTVRVRGVGAVLATDAGWLACHDVRATRRSVRRRVVVGDAGGLRTLMLGRPRRLCVPLHDGDGPELLCHAVDPVGAADRATPPRGPVATALGRVEGVAGAPNELCVTSARTVMSTPPEPDPVDPPVGSVLRVGKVTRTLVVGDEARVRAFVDRTDGRTSDWSKRVEFHSSDERVAVVRGDVIEALAPGTVEVSAVDPATGLASSGDGNAVVSVAWPLTRLYILPALLALPIGTRAHVDVWGVFESGPWRNLTARVGLTSSAPDVATVSEDGTVHAVGLGFARLVATDPISGLTNNAEAGTNGDVYVTDGLVRIDIRGEGASNYYPPARAVGESYRFTAIGVMSDGSEQNLTQRCRWRSSDPTIAVAVDAPGDRSRIDAVQPGAVTVSCRDPLTGLPSNEHWFDVLGALARIDIHVGGYSQPVRPGKPAWGTAIGVYHPFADSGYHGRRNLTQEVTWVSRNPEIVAADNPPGARSRIDFVASGWAQVYATDPTTGIVSYDVPVRVAGDPIALQFLRGARARVQVGGALYYGVLAVFDGGISFNMTRKAPEEYVLEADDPTIAGSTTLGGGVPGISGLRAGVTSIRARHLASGVVSPPVALTVLGDLERIVIEPASVLLGIGETRELVGFGVYAPGVRFLKTQELIYTSSNPSVVVATNDPNSHSRLRAVSPGFAVISATDPVTGLTSTASGDDVTVEVIAGPPTRISVTPSEVVLAPNLSTQLTAHALWPDGRTTNVTQQVVWTSRVPGVVVTANEAGARSRVDARTPGVATVSARHPSGIVSTFTGGDAIVRVLAITARTLAPAQLTARVGQTVRFTFTGTLADGSSLNLTQRAGYGTSDWGIAEAANVGGDRSAYTCMSPGTVDVQAYSDDLPGFLGPFYPVHATLVCIP